MTHFLHYIYKDKILRNRIMPLHKISILDPEYHHIIQGNDIKRMGVYMQEANKQLAQSPVLTKMSFQILDKQNH
ncbi:MAG: hypothetical protein DSM106950_04180 [Stigonema ocellatum SAG 48.90 = DSM 106950]|nr:hypothetical protein [Stigonema ocellatum SAG 48.90 = DSM 106950]